MVLLIVAGVLGIVFANRITVADGRGYGSATYHYGYETMVESDDKLVGERTHKGSIQNSKAIAEIEALRAENKKLASRIAETESSVSKTNDRLDALEKDFETTKEEVGTIRKVVSNGSPRLEFLVTAFATRFGIAAVVLLLVKILTSIYRYHARLSAHYDSKADALELCPAGNIADFEKLCLAITPSGVDFQESADSIAEHAVEIAKKVIPGRS